MASDPLLLGIDLGTSAVKAVVIDGSGRVHARAAVEHPLSAPRPNRAEQDPADWWDATCRALDAALARLADRRAVRAIGLSGQMHGLVALDAADRVLRPAILWCDQRGVEEGEAITEAAGGLDGLLTLVHNRQLPGFTGAKILWMRRHEPELFGCMRRFLLPKDHLRLLLTGRHATDVSEASGTGLFDVARRCWSEPLLGIVGLRPDQVPEAVESSVVTGGLLPEVARRFGLDPGIPVVGGGGDAVVQTTATGIVDAGLYGITIGTGGIVSTAARFCPDNPEGRLQISCGNAPDRWHVMGVALSAGGSFHWLRDLLREVAGEELGFDRLVQLAERVPPGSGGLLFAPFLSGERCPHIAPHARGAWIGLTRAHGLGHLVRALAEGVVMNLRAIRDLCDRVGLPCHDLRVSGGAAASAFWRQLVADVFGRDAVTVTHAQEGGAFGAALLAGVGIGVWPDIDAATAVIGETGRTPPHPAHAAFYDRLQPLHAALFDRLAPVFDAVAALPPVE